MNIKTAMAIGLASLVAAPAAANATPRDIPVPAGKVEHRVRTISADASYTVAGKVPFSIKNEEWTSRDRYYSRITDVQTGELVAETFQTGNRVAIWTAEEGNHVSSAPRSPSGRPAMLGHSFAEEAWIQRYQIDKGWYDKTGETETTLEFVSDPDAPSDGDNTTTLVLNRDFTVVRRTTESRLDNGGWFKQSEETLVRETLDASAAPRGAFTSMKAKVAKKRAAKRTRRG